MKIELGRVKEPVSSERKEARCCAGMEDFAFDAAIRDSSQMQPTADGATEGKAAEGTVSVRFPNLDICLARAAVLNIPQKSTRQKVRYPPCSFQKRGSEFEALKKLP